MPQLGPLEIIAVAVIALIVFGPQRLPEIARTMGRMISEFKRQANELTSEFKSGLDLGQDEDEDLEPVAAGLYANPDDAEADPAEPPLTAGAEASEPSVLTGNGAPDPGSHTPGAEAESEDHEDPVEEEGGDLTRRERDG
ncbi:MAG: twin-arginine translocase TatA/TatE family subunit [Actinomycetota bacterium]|nr:twin-arginine translocase TatA/TatE family subunit [Actinomycetota bacterium]